MGDIEDIENGMQRIVILKHRDKTISRYRIWRCVLYFYLSFINASEQILP